MNIYFSGSIKWADHAKENYPAIIEELKKYGTVLTEHIWLLAQWINHNVADTAEGVFQADVNFIDQSDVVVAEVSAPSLGVWWELAYAQYVRKIPIYCFHVSWARVSRMVLGNDYVQLQEYTTLEEVSEMIRGVFVK
jgi:nucleoside 2-deoxyribosyltransferase